MVWVPRIGCVDRPLSASVQPGLLAHDAQHPFVVDPGACSRQHAGHAPILVARKRQNDLFHRLADPGNFRASTGLLPLMLIVPAPIDAQPTSRVIAPKALVSAPAGDRSPGAVAGWKQMQGRFSFDADSLLASY